MFREFLIFMALSLVGLVLILIALFWMDSEMCKAKWRDSGLTADYGLLSGCRVRDPELGWIPADNYRSVD